MESRSDFSLKALNTFDVEASTRRYVRFVDENEISEFLGRQSLDEERFLVMGGGSNLLFVDDFDGIVLHPVLKGIDVLDADERHVRIRAMAGENWDDLVAHAVASGWGGIENLSLIHGSVGASAVQNIGAYGVEARDVIDSVEATDIHSREKILLPAEACGFGYRTSHFKGLWAGRHIISGGRSRNPAPVAGAFCRPAPLSPAGRPDQAVRRLDDRPLRLERPADRPGRSA